MAERWDNLSLFTPAQFNGLPGLAFPAKKNYCPTKEEVANYLETYTSKFQLPVKLNTKVFHASKVNSGYKIETSSGVVLCKQVVVTSGYYSSHVYQSLQTGWIKRLDSYIHQNTQIIWPCLMVRSSLLVQALPVFRLPSTFPNTDQQ